MDMPRLLRPEGKLHEESRLRKLAQEAGLSEEPWRRREDLAGDIYDCPQTDLHRGVSRNEYGRAVQKWATSQNLSIVKVHERAPSLLKKGSIATSSGQFAVVVLFPSPLQSCKVQYRPNRWPDDHTKGQPVDWLDPVLLPENSGLILLSGEMKFEVIIFECGVAKNIKKEEDEGQQSQ
ncbi:hypothetical protein QBC46DRAFT_370952 [Diplogelasinospora grovesii]|uniref:Uncharacterized protein n=1 Tax=Diplogelasinospora grovesii TaxID=303347 RepID=A0AAN6SA78_9PEZI|nr:hypothetical protein QBC46DRAFT_370952 [Diplogelasinospora grovesii]